MGGKQPLWIPLAGGIATDIADDLLPLGRSLEIQNMQFAETGKLVKRFGNTTIPRTGAVVAPWQMAKYDSARAILAATGSQALSTFSPNKNAWVGATSDTNSPIASVLLTKMATKSGTNPKIASGAGYYYLLYQDSFDTSVTHFDVVDQITKELVSAQTITGGIAVAWAIKFCNGFAVAAVKVGGAITLYTMTPATLAFSTTAAGVAASGAAHLAILLKDAATISVAYVDNVNNAAAFDFVPSTLVVTAWGPRNAAAAAIPAADGVAWMDDLSASGKIALITRTPGGGGALRVQWDIPTAGATRQAVSTYDIDTTLGSVSANVTGHTIGNSATGEFHVLVSPIVGSIVTKLGVRTGGVVTPAFVLYRSVAVLTETFQYSGEFYALFSYAAEGEGNSYAMRIPRVTAQPALALPQATFGVGSTGNTTPTGTQNFGVRAVISPSAGVFVTAIQFLNRIGRQADGNYGVNSLGVELAQLSFVNPSDPTQTGTPIEAFGSLFVPGGTIMQFDGVTYAEMGFAYPPPEFVTSFTPAIGAGGMTSSATYWYCFVFARFDAQGKLERSAPSVPHSVVMGVADNQVTVPVPTLRVTGWSNGFTEIYRGAANDNVEFQKVGQIANVLTADTVNYLDTASDTALAIGEPLYTNGDTPQASALPNTTIPGSPFLFMFQNRFCFVSGDDRTELWFSNKSTPTNGVRFNTQNVQRYTDERGPLYGAAALDDKVIAFKEAAVYSFNGDGPDDAGNGAFSQPQITTLGVGCNEPRSIVADKDGVFFNSTSPQPGIQKIDRGLSLAKDANGRSFGSAVMRYATETIVSAILIPEQSHVRFYCASGRVLVYDLNAQLWATFLLNTSGASVVSAAAIGGVAMLATDDVALFLEDTSGSFYNDNGQSFVVTLTGPWIQGTGPKAFERVSELIGTGTTIAAHSLVASMYINLDDGTIVNTKTFAMTPGSTPRWNWEWIPRVQRMSAAKVSLSETSSGAGFQAEGITALIGSKPGLARQPTTTRGP